MPFTGLLLAAAAAVPTAVATPVKTVKSIATARIGARIVRAQRILPTDFLREGQDKMRRFRVEKGRHGEPVVIYQ